MKKQINLSKNQKERCYFLLINLKEQSIILAIILILALTFHWSSTVQWIVYLFAGIFVFCLILKPMSTVYGLVGGSANIRIFLVNFFLITILFSFVYYGLFFKSAGICYDDENPRIDYTMFAQPDMLSKDTVFMEDVAIVYSYKTAQRIIVEERVADSIIGCQQVCQTHIDTTACHYYKISRWMVLKNSFLTSLTQAPSDFFFEVSDFGENININSSDQERTALFSVILLLHVLISWIFLGVFISLLYSKFRYEA